ncbi:MAG: ATPase, T2SS/T4P/T4SS family, partial [Candidatus Adiutrix sp.]
IDGSRFEGLVPPVVAAPTFTIRKKSSKVFTLNDYFLAGNISQEALEILEFAVINKKNILVAGGTGSGKTTFVNALVEAIDRLAPDDRLVVIEDTSELQVKSKNQVILHTTVHTDMHDLLKATMRLRPDRILVGEVRDVAVLALTNAWNTGHAGGLATIHANSAAESLERVEQLITVGNFTPVKKSLANAINYVVFMRKERGLRKVTEIVAVGFDDEKQDYVFDYKYIFNPELIREFVAA